MNKNDFSQWEDNMKSKVEKSIHSIPFDHLGRNVESIVNKTMEQAMREVEKVLKRKDYVEQRMDDMERKFDSKFDSYEKKRGSNNTTARTYQRNRQRTAYQRRTYQSQPNMYQKGAAKPATRATDTPSFPIAKTPRGTISGILYAIIGGVGAASMGFSLICVIFSSLMLGFSAELFFSIVFLICVLGCFGLLFQNGVEKRRRVRRFKQYVKIMDGQCHYPIEKLAVYTDQKKEAVAKDLNKMIKLEMFSEGHLDEEKTELILDNKTYELYLNVMHARKQKEKEQEYLRQQREQSDISTVKEAQFEKENDKVETVLLQGSVYLDKIRECNDKITDEFVSEKLFKLEYITKRIFEHIKKYPEKIDKIEKFMDYYLPTTLKLVTTYEELDKQPIEGQNIKKTKNEIKSTLDTINEAFEKLLDSLFEEQMLDISTDISVLETVLKQEGLTKSDFSMDFESTSQEMKKQ